jgi:hypothetical protein
MQALLKCGKRNLTAEIAELAEVEKAKGLRDKEISEKDLCVLRFLFVHPLVFVRREFGRPQRGGNGHTIIPFFRLLEEKALRPLRTLRFNSFLRLRRGHRLIVIR